MCIHGSFLSIAAAASLFAWVLSAAAQPPVTNGLAAWYDAGAITGLTNGEPVSVWSDLSGNNRVLIQDDTARRPVYRSGGLNGRPSVDFDGADDRLSVATANMTAREIFAVTVVDNTSNWRNLVSNGSDGNNIRAYGGTYRDIEINDFPLGGYFRQNNAYDKRLVAGKVHILDAAAATDKLYPVFMVGDNGAHNRYWDGDVAEVMVYDHELSEVERADVGYYLTEKYGIGDAYEKVTLGTPPAIGEHELGFSGLLAGTDGGTSTTVRIYWGPADAGTNAAAWAYTNVFLPSTVPYAFSTNLVGLPADTVYYYRVQASNSVALSWNRATGVARTRFAPITDGWALWLSADTITGVTNGGVVSAWSDTSGSNRHASDRGSINHPAYVTNALGGQPVVRFNGSNDNYFAFGPVANIRTVFWVVREDADATPGRFLLGYYDGATQIYNFHRGVNSKLIWYNHSGAAPAWQGVTRLDGIRINGLTTELPPRPVLLSLVTASAAQANTLVSDRGIAGRTWDGDVAELILFNRALSAFEEQAVGHYLARKYGLDADYGAVNNGEGATDVAMTTATLNGGLHEVAGGLPVDVTVYWGATDAGTNAIAWAHTNRFAGAFSDPTPFATNLTGLAELTTYYYRFRASNAAAVVWAPSSAAFRTRGHAVTNGLTLWLDAATVGAATNGQHVARLPDWSGRLNDARQPIEPRCPVLATNVLNGQPAVHFDGVTNYMDGTFPLSAQTVIMVCRMEPDAPNLSGIFSQSGADQQNIRSQAGRWNATANGGNTADFCYGGASYINGADGATHNHAYHVFEMVAAAKRNFNYRLSQPLVLNGFHRNFKGDLCEALVYDRTLTAGERLDIGRYINARYGLPNNAAVVRVTQASAVKRAGAILGGELALTGAVVRAYWGTSDGGSLAAAWDRSAELGSLGRGSLAYAASGLTPETDYYYRYYVSNDTAFGWSPFTARFRTLPNNPVTDGMLLWYTATAITNVADGATVAAWPDLSGAANTGNAHAGGHPVFVGNGLDGRPVVRFDGGTNTYFTFRRLDTIRTVFWVVKEDADATHLRFLLGSEGIGDIYHFHRDAAATKYIWGNSAHVNVKNGVTRLDGRIVNGLATRVPTEFGIISLVTTGNTTANAFSSDRQSQGVTPIRTWDGDLAELIIYDRPLSDEEENQVGSYLTQRYGLSTAYWQAGSVLIVR